MNRDPALGATASKSAKRFCERPRDPKKSVDQQKCEAPAGRRTVLRLGARKKIKERRPAKCETSIRCRDQLGLRHLRLPVGILGLRRRILAHRIVDLIIVHDIAIDREFMLPLLQIRHFIALDLRAIGFKCLFVLGRALVATRDWQMRLLLTPKVEIHGFDVVILSGLGGSR
jgi:hypothetical protein